MINTLVNRLVGEFEKNKIIKSDDREIYEYGAEVLINNIILMTTIFLIGYIINKLAYTILFMIFYPLLRKYTGGYHASERWKCFLLTNLVHLGVVYLWQMTKLSMSEYILSLFLIFSIAIVFCIDPIENENNPKSEDDIYRNRYYARGLMCVMAVVSFVGFNLITAMQGLCFTLAVIMFMVTLMMLPSYFKNGGV